MPVIPPRRRWLVLAFLLVAFALLWRPLLKPAGQAFIVIADLFGEQLVGVDVAKVLTPESRVRETSETFGGIAMRVSEWRPGRGDRHPAILLVPGSSPEGNDLAELRQFAATLARAGYLVYLPELPFLKEARLDPSAIEQIGDAFAAMRALPTTQGQAAGAFGISVGGGIMLVAAGSEPGFADAAFLTVLGPHYDMDTFIASIASGEQRLNGDIVPWNAMAQARQRLHAALLEITPPSARAELADLLLGAPYDESLLRVLGFPAEARAVYDTVSPERVWLQIPAPVYWMHDPYDGFVPLAEAHAALAASRLGQMTLLVPSLIQHAAVSKTDGEGPLSLAGELWAMLTFSFSVLRLAG